MHLVWQGACIVVQKWALIRQLFGLRMEGFQAYVIKDALGVPCVRRTILAPMASAENVQVAITNQGQVRRNALTWMNVQLAAVLP